MIKLRWKRIGGHDLPMPRRARPTEAGHDLPAVVDSRMGSSLASYHASEGCESLTVYPGALVVFRTGWAVEIPPTHFGLVHVRSSIGKARWMLASSGVVDPSFRGEVVVPLLYLGAAPCHVHHGDRVAQMMVVERPDVEDEEVADLAPSWRGEAGFGSTGR